MVTAKELKLRLDLINARGKIADLSNELESTKRELEKQNNRVTHFMNANCELHVRLGKANDKNIR